MMGEAKRLHSGARSRCPSVPLSWKAWLTKAEHASPSASAFRARVRSAVALELVTDACGAEVELESPIFHVARHMRSRRYCITAGRAPDWNCSRE